MAPAVKLIDKRPNDSHRHHGVYKAFGKIGVSVKKVHDAKGAFYAIVSDENLEIVLLEENKDVFREEGYEVIPPIEYNAMKTMVAKSLDYMIDEYTDQEIGDSIEDLNEGLKVEDIYRIPTTSKMIKVRFTTNQMAQTALKKGLVVLYQSIPANKIEKEIFVKLTPCRNCYDYDHREKDCPIEKKMRCTFCAGEHRQNECTAKDPMCINCGGQHRTLAAAYKVRKDLIKKRSKEIRDRSRSRSRARTATHYATYSAAIQLGASETRGPGTRQMDEPMMSKEESKLMMTTIMSAIIYAQYMEAVEPGSYQRNIDEIYKLNGLPPIKFPPPRMTGAVLQACREIFKEQTKEQEESSVRETESGDMDNISDEAIEREGMEIDRLIKRSRESLTPPLRDEKRKKDGSSSTQSKRPPIPPGKPQQPPHPSTQGAGRGAVPKEQRSREREKVKGRKASYPGLGPPPCHPNHHSQIGTLPEKWGLYVYVN